MRPARDGDEALRPNFWTSALGQNLFFFFASGVRHKTAAFRLAAAALLGWLGKKADVDPVFPL